MKNLTNGRAVLDEVLVSGTDEDFDQFGFVSLRVEEFSLDGGPAIEGDPPRLRVSRNVEKGLDSA
jgi:hypothetical protein